MPDAPATTYVETRDVPLRDLTRFPGNAKRGAVDEIAASIRRNGQYRALVVRDTGGDNQELVILAGNHTHQALGVAGASTARCEIIRCDDETARRINLADNRLAELGSYDNDALAELLSYLDGDYDGTGWTAADVDDLLDPPTPEPEESPSGVGEPVISYQLVFDNDVQQSSWFEFLRHLKSEYPDLETTGERLHAHLGGMPL